MRVLHTADWHFGRVLEGRSRLPEHEAFVEELVAIVREEQIDLVLVAGDVYDGVNPAAQSEELFYDALVRLSQGGRVPIVVIAGNHDHPDRLHASSPLAAKQGIHLFGLPIEQTITLPLSRAQQTAVIYPLAYPSEARLNELLSIEADEAMLREAYSDRIAAMIQQQASAFRRDTVNIVMSHLFASGGVNSESERPIEVGGAYTVDATSLCGIRRQSADSSMSVEISSIPPEMPPMMPTTPPLLPQYVALGHLHRAQQLTAPGDTIVRYSGSPLAFSFAEHGQAKSVTIIDLSPGELPTVKEVPLSSGRPLIRWRPAGGLEEVYRWIDEGRDSRAWIELELRLTEALTTNHIQQLRKLREGLVIIRPVYVTDQDQADAPFQREDVPMDEIFRRFHRKQTGGAEATPELVRLFLELLNQNTEEVAP